MKTIIALLVMVGLSGCLEEGYTRVSGPRAKLGYSVDCRGEGKCYKLAGILCPSGYGVVSQDYHNAIAGGISGNLVVECR